MASFGQALASGIGEGGAQVATGAINAQDKALQVAQMQHNWQQDAIKNSLAQQQLAQTNSIAQQQHDLARQQLISNGYLDMGTTLDPVTQQYTRTLYNKYTNQTIKLPVQGIPPDSPAGQLNYYKQLLQMKDDKNQPIFNPFTAMQTAFKMPAAFQKGPAELMAQWRQDAQSLYSQGVTKVTGPNGKLIDISTPTGQQEYAQAQVDLQSGRAGYYHYGPGSLGLGAGRDMTGFTPGEKRQFDAQTTSLKAQQQTLLSEMNREVAATLNPVDQPAVIARYTPQLQTVDANIQNVYNSIRMQRFGSVQLPGQGGAAQPVNGQPAQQSVVQPPRPANVPVGWTYKNGPKGLGWYKP